MLCYDWSKQQHSFHRQIKTQHLFLLLLRHYYLLLGAGLQSFWVFFLHFRLPSLYPMTLMSNQPQDLNLHALYHCHLNIRLKMDMNKCLNPNDIDPISRSTYSVVIPLSSTINSSQIMQKIFQNLFTTRSKQNQPLTSFTDSSVWN